MLPAQPACHFRAVICIELHYNKQLVPSGYQGNLLVLIFLLFVYPLSLKDKRFVENKNRLSDLS